MRRRCVPENSLHGRCNSARTETGAGRIPSRGAVLAGVEAPGRRGPDLTGTDLRESNLAGSRLAGARMEGAKLKGANRDGAKLPRAVQLPERGRKLPGLER